MSIETDDELNFLPDEIEWAAEYPPAIHNQVEGIVPAIHNRVEGIVTEVFLVGALMVAGFFLLGILAMIFSPQLEDSQPQQVQKIQQPPEQKPATANRPVFPKALLIDGMIAQLDQNGNTYGSLPKHLEFGHNTSPMRVFDTPRGRVTAVFPTGTRFVLTRQTYQSHWRWVINFDGVKGYANFQVSGLSEDEPQQVQKTQQPTFGQTMTQQVNKLMRRPPLIQVPSPEQKPATASGPVFIKTLQLHGWTFRLDQNGNTYGPLPEYFEFGRNTSPMRVFDTPGGRRVTAVFPTDSRFLITKPANQSPWRLVINFDGVQGFTTFKP